MEAYIYCADVYCEDCAEKIKEGLRTSAPGSIHHEDSDSYPQGPYADGSGESDCPEHCGGCGLFLENPLTSHGYDYVREALLEHAESGRGAPDVLKKWRDFYEIHPVMPD